LKAIIITGAKDSGKSTTIQELCRQLKPKNIWQIKINTLDKKKSKLEVSSIDAIYNNVFIIEVQNKFILILAGCPTEIDIRITTVIDICFILNIDISIVVTAKRTSERKKNFNSKDELKKMGFIISEERIQKVKLTEFRDSIEWKNRIDKLKEMILKEI
jgi:hypothetical protein